MAFSSDDANRWLEQLASEYASQGAEFHPVGGYRLNGKCEYDAYVAIGARAPFGASLAIRLPKGREPYYAIVRKSKGRRISEDRIPFDQRDLAAALFGACAKVVSLGGAARTSAWNADLEADSP